MDMEAYIDTSLLVKIYVPEEDSAEKTAFLMGYARPICLNHLQESELANALHLKLFRKEISAAELKFLSKKIAADIESGILVKRNINWPHLFVEACSLSKEFTGRIGCRMIDILHVAAAKLSGASYFFTCDVRQKKLAEAAGFKTSRENS